MAAPKNPMLGPFLGMNNRLPDNALRTKEGDWLRSGVNVDLIASRLKLRPGYALKQSGSDVHSHWGDGDAFGYYVDGATLYRVRLGPDSGISRESVRSDLTPGLRVSFDRAESGEVYYSNGIEFGRDDGTTHHANWGTHSVVAGTDTAYCRTMPAGTIVRFYRNRLLAARGPTLFASQPWKFNLYSAIDGLIPWLADVKVVAPLESVLFLATTQATYRIDGDIVVNAQVRQVLPYGALAGSERLLRHEKAALWMSPRGMVRATDDGAVANLQDKALATGSGDSAATLFREYDGTRRAIAAVNNATSTVTAAQSWMDAEIVRKETTL